MYIHKCVAIMSYIHENLICRKKKILITITPTRVWDFLVNIEENTYAGQQFILMMYTH